MVPTIDASVITIVVIWEHEQICLEFPYRISSKENIVFRNGRHQTSVLHQAKKNSSWNCQHQRFFRYSLTMVYAAWLGFTRTTHIMKMAQTTLVIDQRLSQQFLSRFIFTRLKTHGKIKGCFRSNDASSSFFLEKSVWLPGKKRQLLKNLWKLIIPCIILS